MAFYIFLIVSSFSTRTKFHVDVSSCWAGKFRQIASQNESKITRVGRCHLLLHFCMLSLCLEAAFGAVGHDFGVQNQQGRSFFFGLDFKIAPRWFHKVSGLDFWSPRRQKM